MLQMCMSIASVMTHYDHHFFMDIISAIIAIIITHTYYMELHRYN